MKQNSSLVTSDWWLCSLFVIIYETVVAVGNKKDCVSTFMFEYSCVHSFKAFIRLKIETFFAFILPSSLKVNYIQSLGSLSNRLLECQTVKQWDYCNCSSEKKFTCVNASIQVEQLRQKQTYEPFTVELHLRLTSNPWTSAAGALIKELVSTFEKAVSCRTKGTRIE